MEKITFEQLPSIVSQLCNKLENIEKLLQARINAPPPEQDSILTVKEAADFLSLTVPTIYTLISKGKLPAVKDSKRCYFFKSELISYLKANRKKTFKDLEEDAELYLKNYHNKM